MRINDYIFYPNEPNLGQGRFSIVKRPGVKVSGYTIAVKNINKNPRESVDNLTLTEVKIWKIFDYPNIVKYYKHFQTEDKFYIIMEYTNGEDLAALID
jgi:serine/threonine-protein kinase ULK/ATG1